MQADSFNGDLSSWNVGKVTTMERSTFTQLSSSNLVCDADSSFHFWFALMIFNLIKCLFFLPILRIGTFVVSVRAVFEGALGFNGDLSSWDVGKVRNMASSTYIIFPPLQILFVMLIPRSIFWFALIIFNLIKCLFSSHVHRWTVVVSVSAVFAHANNFNGDLSSWDVGKVSSMVKSTYITFHIFKSCLGCCFLVPFFGDDFNLIFFSFPPIFF